MGGFFGVASKGDCVFDLFFGTDYHSHLGTRRAGMCVYDKENGFDRAIHSIENSPFRTKFDKEANTMKGCYGIGCISDFEAQPVHVRSHHGSFAITTVGKINNSEEIVEKIKLILGLPADCSSFFFSTAGFCPSSFKGAPQDLQNLDDIELAV